ncbi:hypothetical protein PanWU01x14_334100, partial [Parasponia andersonii]
MAGPCKEVEINENIEKDEELEKGGEEKNHGRDSFCEKEHPSNEANATPHQR